MRLQLFPAKSNFLPINPIVDFGSFLPHLSDQSRLRETCRKSKFLALKRSLDRLGGLIHLFRTLH